MKNERHVQGCYGLQRSYRIPLLDPHADIILCPSHQR
jgi:hypothetical protein